MLYRTYSVQMVLILQELDAYSGFDSLFVFEPDTKILMHRTLPSKTLAAMGEANRDISRSSKYFPSLQQQGADHGCEAC